MFVTFSYEVLSVFHLQSATELWIPRPVPPKLTCTTNSPVCWAAVSTRMHIFLHSDALSQNMKT